MKRNVSTLLSVALVASLLAACSNGGGEAKAENKNGTAATTQQSAANMLAAHKGLNQAPVPLKMERVGPHDVHIEMTAQITDIEIDKGKIYKAWTFNGQAPGPLVVVNEGDTIHFTLKNMDTALPHSMDFHAVHAAPSKDFVDVMPGKSGTFTYPANNPGVFMYHCGTKPVLQHIANGMHGVIIVKPKNGYPTDKEVDREYVLIQNEWYKYNDMNDFQNGVPSYVVFSTKALRPGDPNTNGDTFTLKEKPLLAKVGEKIRLYVNNVGPNEVSSFHVVGTVFDDVYLDGNPSNHLQGMQTVMLPASGGAVVEFTVTRPGTYPIVTHQFNNAQKGAVAMLKVTETGEDDGSETSGH
ncbi:MULTISPECIES: multicopper oxidase domain-containing protein [Geobacillus]|uniref:Copper-containing nitrite reductase n=1 Tax=Geobacillus stearothermophilus TaxID=1422 RepID=A0ABQ7HFQ1_GEOSE|nr:multicopper oxidase domain-containing protein [Geobacillus stearothermophilus]KAF6510966.1 Copper-containing nitrite reductase [Geobacillus stearothermophilus]KMY57176.1 nitrite reductase [Geobacillus stearothermophilus]KMY57651.1 nitrite reductase [Geobacillus stearothermophilus]KMY60796.1 nitrite reductase [Geobacillus stearothermophilus]MED3843907.1 multicopper oxidase domain-containing protein [Geobacillus stearothermophilus]